MDGHQRNIQVAELDDMTLAYQQVKQLGFDMALSVGQRTSDKGVVVLRRDSVRGSEWELAGTLSSSTTPGITTHQGIWHLRAHPGGVRPSSRPLSGSRTASSRYCALRQRPGSGGAHRRRLINPPAKGQQQQVGESLRHSTWGMCPTPETDAAARAGTGARECGALATPGRESTHDQGGRGFRAAAVASSPALRPHAAGRQFDGGSPASAPLCGCLPMAGA